MPHPATYGTMDSGRFFYFVWPSVYLITYSRRHWPSLLPCSRNVRHERKSICCRPIVRMSKRMERVGVTFDCTIQFIIVRYKLFVVNWMWHACSNSMRTWYSYLLNLPQVHVWSMSLTTCFCLPFAVIISQTIVWLLNHRTLCPFALIALARSVSLQYWLKT